MGITITTPSVHKMKLLRATSLPFPPPLLQFLTIPPLGFFFRFPCTVNFPGWVGGGIVRIDCLAKVKNRNHYSWI